MKKILYIATSDIHLRTFHIPYLKWLVERQHVVDLAFEDRGGFRFDMARRVHLIDYPRRLHLPALRNAYHGLKHVIANGDYDILHCHTPIPSALTRLAARKWRRQGGKLLYTSHGFHFYKGAPLKAWLTYFPSELVLSHMTDFIVTINAADMAYTQGRLWGAPSARIPGMGVQPRGFGPVSSETRLALRKELGFGAGDFILLYVAEFIPRKNHRFIIDAAQALRATLPDLKIVLLGQGELLAACKDDVRNRGLQETVRFMGFRDDVAKFAQAADIGISTSRHEGLGLALLEQMMCAVPVVATRDRGHQEFVEHGETGFLFAQGDHTSFGDYVRLLHDDRDLLARMGAKANTVAKRFEVSKSVEEMGRVYERFL